VVTGRKNYGDR